MQPMTPLQYRTALRLLSREVFDDAHALETLYHPSGTTDSDLETLDALARVLCDSAIGPGVYDAAAKDNAGMLPSLVARLAQRKNKR
jgi:hypothetical protein